MQRERIRYFRVRPSETTASCHGELFEHRDPGAHVAAVLDLVAEAAAHAAKASSPTSEPRDAKGARRKKRKKNA